jgi:trigger factor
VVVSDLNVAVTVEDISPVKKKISFDIPWADVSKELDTVYTQVGKKARIKGFRPGKVPRRVLETYYKEHAEEETISNLINKHYWDALKEHSIPAVTQPVVDQTGIEANKNFAFSATVEVEAPLEPKEYTGLKLEKEELPVTDADVEARILQIREMFATLEDVTEDRGLKEGDFATFDFEGVCEGKALKELKADGYFLEIGSKMFVPGFEDQMIGMKKGEKKQIVIKFPDDYQGKDVAGKDVTFDVDLKGIRGKKLPELNDDFIKNFEQKYETLADFTADVRKSLEEANKTASQAGLREKIIEGILEKNDFEVPPSFVERQIYIMMADAQRKFMARGMEKDAAMQLSFKHRDRFKDDAVKIVKSLMLIKGIAEKEAIKVEEDELNAKVAAMAAERQQSFEAMKESLEKDDMLESVRLDLLHEKTMAYLEAQAEITIVTKKNTKDEKETKETKEKKSKKK